jgi:hypothetical protein
MFQLSTSQGSLFESQFQMSDKKHKRLEKTWAKIFYERCFPLIDESLFRSFYCEDNGAPCKSIRVVVSALILQAIFDLTDAETQAAVDFDLRWHLALGLDPCDDHDYVSQRTLQYFQEKLITHETALLLFNDLTDRLIAELGINTGQQRLDSTHIVSNFAIRSRLGVFCETHRVFLHALRRADMCSDTALLTAVAPSLRRRYMDDEGTDTHYDDARASDSRRRLSVAARDAYRLRETFRGVVLPPAAAEAYALVERLVAEHCTIVAEPSAPAADDGDADLAAVPVVVKEAKTLSASSLQTPHDPDVTYSGHKGQGYEVLIMETCNPTNEVQLITHVSLKRSCESDSERVIPAITALEERGLTPESVLADTAFGSTENVVASAQHGVELISPQPGNAPKEAPHVPEFMVNEHDFQVQLTPSAPPSCCPLGVVAMQTRLLTTDADGPIALLQMPTASCQTCDRRGWCPAMTMENGDTLVMLPLNELLPCWRRADESEDSFRERYNVRAGIEGTNSELKRGQGLGHLRVRGAPRVSLAMYLRMIACNMKRAMRYWGDTRKKANKCIISEDITLKNFNFRFFSFGKTLYYAICGVLSNMIEFRVV